MGKTTDILYAKDANNDLARFAQKKLRKIYSAPSLDNYEVWEIDEARQKLLQYKSHGMISWDWKYQNDIQYLWDRIRTNDYTQDTKAIFDIIQESYKTILMNDNTQDLETLHLALVEAIHEWAFKYRFEAEVIKKKNEKSWLRVIEYIANKLCDEIDAYYDEYQKMCREARQAL